MKLHVLLVLLVVLTSELHAACPGGWDKYNNNCYKKFPAASWNEGRSGCARQDAVLADVQIRREAENEFIKNKYGGNNWLGISRCHRNSTCLLDFSSAKWTNWAADQPDRKPQNPPGLKNRHFAVLIQADGTWLDQPKSEEHSYICQKPEDPCKDNFCNPDGSTCVNGTCQCKPGYSGEFCYVGPCDKDPCQNGGTCKAVNANYTCTCVNHYSGKNCEVLPPCKTKNPCINGVCEDISAVDYRCKCNPGWIGKNCDERPCDRQPCSKLQECRNKGYVYECVCLDGWTGAKCEKDGSAGGDPHYRTFDGKRYDFMGKCEYIFAKDCSEEYAFEVRQQNEACGSGSVSCTKTIKVLTQSIEVIMERRGVVYIDGIRVNLPWKKSGSDTKIIKWAGGAFLDVPDLLFSVRWDGYTGVNVKINQHYQGRMCGLMGNADNNPNNDFQLPDGNFTNDLVKSANSWKTNPKCVNGIVPPDPCNKLSASEYNYIKEKCGNMKQSPFRQCNGRIKPDNTYIRNCEYDMCAMKGNRLGAWCQTLENYDKACGSRGVKIEWEGKPGFEECGNPCSNIPCFNGAKCENINTKQFKCTCPKGFGGPTCENVVCKTGYITRGSFCYKRMGKRPWIVARCPTEDIFVSAENENENKFIYEKFVKPSGKAFWMNARVCGEGKLCDQGFGTVFYHNFVEGFSSTGCVEMSYGKNGKWAVKNCKAASYYICKYEKF